MADLFGAWVPQKWIDDVLKAVAENPQWNFLFLTKNPVGLAEIEWPANAWVGTTVDRQARVVPAIAAFQQIRAARAVPVLRTVAGGIELSHPGLFRLGDHRCSVEQRGRAGNSAGPQIGCRRSRARCGPLESRSYFKPNLRSAVRDYPDHDPPAPYYGPPIDLPELIARIDPNHKPVWNGISKRHQEHWPGTSCRAVPRGTP